LQVCRDNRISMCGQVATAFALMTLREAGVRAQYQEIAYATSAEVTGNKERVVGYAGVLFH